MISKTKPEDFTPAGRIATCRLEHDGKLLLLLRHEDDALGNLWGPPGGKVEDGESLEEGVVREVFEEAGLRIDQKELVLAGTYYVTHLDWSFMYYAFRLQLSEKPEIELEVNNPEHIEHTDFRWVTPAEALQLPLIPDEDFCIRDIYKVL